MRLQLSGLLIAAGLALASFHDRTPLQNRRHSHANALLRKYDYDTSPSPVEAREDPTATRSRRAVETDILLRPAIDPNHNLSDYNNLKPNKEHTLFYSSQRESLHQGVLITG
jgi:hypothetical protein